MSKRPAINLADLTAEAAAPMTEASQRAPRPAPAPRAVAERAATPERPRRGHEGRVPTENLQGLAFKVPPAFRKRFRQRAADADLKLNELLFQALDAWEEKGGIKR